MSQKATQGTATCSRNMYENKSFVSINYHRLPLDCASIVAAVFGAGAAFIVINFSYWCYRQ
tara:strand:+ start:668 stop:850 length:183 start_codon:yes stop_codon:yes gene_type:complete